MEIHGFIGPSIRQEEARILLEAKYHPPAQKGSLFTAVNEGAEIILLIDGMFETVPSVWHKEILWCLNEGVAVLGSSSMGALRACETDRYGMVGVGEIYEYYTRGTTPSVLKYLTEENHKKIKSSMHPKLEVSDAVIDWLCIAKYGRAFMHDDDVAISHGPKDLGFPAVSDAMVDIYFTLSKSPFSLQTKTSLLLLAKSFYFKNRSFSNLIRHAQEFSFLETPAEIADWIDAFSYSQKKEDASNLLKNLDSHLLTIDTKRILEFYETRYWKNNFP